jgi:hypothetical protein
MAAMEEHNSELLTNMQHMIAADVHSAAVPGALWAGPVRRRSEQVNAERETSKPIRPLGTPVYWQKRWAR